MLIEGPITIGVVAGNETAGPELHVDFTQEFKALDLAAQGERFRGYVASLVAQIDGLPPDDPNRAGMLTVQQIAEQLLPHVVAGELALEETIVIRSDPQPPAVSLTSLLD